MVEPLRTGSAWSPAQAAVSSPEAERGDTSPGSASPDLHLPPPFDTLIAGERVTVHTVNSTYYLVLLRRSDCTVLVRGGRFFPRPTEAQLLGFSGDPHRLGRSPGIGARLELAVGHRIIRTSPVVAFQREKSGRA